MKDRQCPRCGQTVPDWQPVHLSCLLDRGKYWGLGLLLIVVVSTVIPRLQAEGESRTAETTATSESTTSNPLSVTVSSNPAGLSPTLVLLATRASEANRASEATLMPTETRPARPTVMPSNTPRPTRKPTRTPVSTSTPETLGNRVAIESFVVIYDAFVDGTFDPNSTHWSLNEERVDQVVFNGQHVLQVQGATYWEGVHVRRKGFTVQPGDGVFFRFSLADTNHAGRFGLRPEDGGFVGLIFHLGSLYPDYNIGNKDIPINLIGVDQNINTWYLAQMSIDLEGRITWRVWRETASGNYIKLIEHTLDSPTTNGFFKNKSFQFYLQPGTRSDNSILYISDYQEGHFGD